MQILIKTLLTLSIFLLFSADSNAQVIAKNVKGETIVQFPDGSWRHYDENNEGDQQLMRDYLMQNQQKAITTTQKQAPKKTTSKKERPVVVKNEDNMPSSYPTNRSQLAAKNRLHNARKAENAAKAKESKTFMKYEQISTKYANLKLRKPKPKAALKQLKLEKKLAKTEMKYAAEARKNATKNTELYRKMVNMPDEDRQVLLAKMETQKASQEAKMSMDDTSTTYTKPNKKEKVKEPKRKKSKSKTPIAQTTQIVDISEGNKDYKDYKLLANEDNVMLNPPSNDCEISCDGVDEFSGKNRRDVAPQLFFTHTDEQLRKHYEGKERITCYGNLTNVTGGYKFLTLKLIVNDERAQRTYGILEKSCMLTLKLIDGTNVALLNNKTDQGVVDSVNRTVTYFGQFMLTPNQQKHLEKTEIDLVRLVWSSGYEDYEIYETDFLIYQFSCLSSETK